MTPPRPVYDFDSVVERRGSDSLKWGRYRERPGLLPMWVADMDFRSAPEILEALHARVEHGVFGYAVPPAGLEQAVLEHMAADFGWAVDPEWLVWLPGLVTGINLACRAVGEAGDEVLTAVPAYPPFLHAPANGGRRLATVPMQLRGGRWTLDPEMLAAALTPRTRLFLLCSPHNPTGRLLDREELQAIAEACLERDVVICSDEIHNMLVLDTERRHAVTAGLSPEVAARTITLMAPSKTWNIAGLGCSYAVIPDPRLRASFRREAAGVVPGVNLAGYAAALAAYRHGRPWLEALLEVLRANRDLLERRVAAMPGVATTRVEATYLAWLDVRELGLPDAAAFFAEAGVGLQEGSEFGAPGWLRLNFGCPRRVLAEALDRMDGALARL